MHHSQGAMDEGERMIKVPMTAKDFREINQQYKELMRIVETAIKHEQDLKIYNELERYSKRIDPDLFGAGELDFMKHQKSLHVESLKRWIQGIRRMVIMNEETIKFLQEVEAGDRKQSHGRR